MLTDLYAMFGHSLYDAVFRANTRIVDALWRFERYLGRWVETLENERGPW